ncbi:DMT family transporter [Leptolyngbya sp. NIES-2104]|uniref:DMT family transporter n=1 Tax=Leptolyngbya sp. NIES-2104 TaxID=1552121 RepID=UPI00073E81EF|nr:DMT family transporter [Leptolyngbya sp. NIES-2104]
MTQPSTDSIRSSWFQTLSTRSILSALVLGSALCALASGSIFMKIATQEMSANQVAFSRVLIAAIVFGVWNSLRSITHQEKPTSEIGWREVGLLTGAGASFASFVVLLAWSLAHTQVANATLLTHMMPIFTTFAGWLFLGQRFSRQFWIGLVIALMGAIAIGVGDLSLDSETIWGDVAALGSAVFIAIELLIVEQLRSKLATPVIAMSESAIASLVLLPLVLWNGAEILPPSFESGLAVLAAALITQVTGHGLLTYSLKQFSAGLVSVALLAVPMIAAGLAMVLFGQMIQWGNAIAFLVVLIGIYLTVSAPKNA